MAQNLIYSDTLVAIECGVCHIPFALPSSFHRSATDRGTWFYCPNGDRIRYSETENQRLRREAEAERRQRQWAESRAERVSMERDAAERSRAATKGAMTKLKKRVHAGVCPHCNRTFKDVAAHMESKHPEQVANP